MRTREILRVERAIARARTTAASILSGEILPEKPTDRRRLRAVARRLRAAADESADTLINQLLTTPRRKKRE